MRRYIGVVLAAAGLALAGCAEGPTKADTGTVIGAVTGGILGNQIGKGGGRALATAAGIFIGGIVGHSIGKSLDEQDRYLAQQATGEPVEWRNPDTGRYGRVVPREAYDRGGQPCREYEHEVFIDGRPEIMVGTACRNRDGTWSNVG